jgi:hypothetical protein
LASLRHEVEERGAQLAHARFFDWEMTGIAQHDKPLGHLELIEEGA